MIRRSLAQARQGELAAFVEVYRALGGGSQQEGLPANATTTTG